MDEKGLGKRKVQLIGGKKKELEEVRSKEKQILEKIEELKTK